MKRSLSAKYWTPYIIAVAIQMIVVMAVMVRFFASTNPLANWFFNAILNTSVVLSSPPPFDFFTEDTIVLHGIAPFNLIIDWATAISATTVGLVVILVFLTVMESRRKNALARMHNWATDAVEKLTGSDTEESVGKKLVDWDQQLRSIIAENDNVLADARAVRNGLKPKVEKAVDNLLKLEECIHNHAETHDLANLLRATVITMQEISSITYNYLNQSH